MAYWHFKVLYDLLNHKTSDTLHYPFGGAFQSKNAMSLFAMVYWHFKCLSKWVESDYRTSVLWFSSQEGRLPSSSQDDKRPKKPDESISSSTIGWCRHVKVTVYRVTPCGASVNNGKAINASTNLTLLLRVLHFPNQKPKQLGVNKLTLCQKNGSSFFDTAKSFMPKQRQNCMDPDRVRDFLHCLKFKYFSFYPFSWWPIFHLERFIL